MIHRRETVPSKIFTKIKQFCNFGEKNINVLQSKLQVAWRLVVGSRSIALRTLRQVHRARLFLLAVPQDCEHTLTEVCQMCLLGRHHCQPLEKFQNLKWGKSKKYLPGEGIHQSGGARHYRGLPFQ